ncbi:hypothetical protein BD289DRAFT_451911 [Coniella lustricola]|uniref:Uncharacterized protein n=1 Tax=Coniella lustricola TaxID=2025994 RepID=A0A2T3AD71_9PEZI|nr:hypothetical protein BD289DRAFT_451911 [Coniella lustricola]
MSDEPRGCLDIIKWWLFAPCSDGTTSENDEDHIYHTRGTKHKDGGLPRGRIVDLSDPEKGFYEIYYEQPRPTPPAQATSQTPAAPAKLQRQPETTTRTRTRSKKQNEMGWIDWNFFSGKRKRMVARRPRISTPSNFRHVGSGAVNFKGPVPEGPRTAPMFRPLQLSIYQSSDNRISPLLPYFAGRERSVSPPQAIRGRSRDVFDDDETTLAHSRDASSMSFHIPRRPLIDGSSMRTASIGEDSPPRIPPRAKTRPRAYTSPSVEAIVERIASAFIERDILDAELESVKSRHSLCLSRPSTSYDPDEPMPPFPVVPPSAPSFAERVSIDRPRTAPSSQVAFEPPPLPLAHVPQSFPERSTSLRAPKWPASFLTTSSSGSGAAAAGGGGALPTTPDTPSAVRRSAFNSHPIDTSPRIIDNSVDIDVPLAPPLPLILRPPLRKKKSFSRVSDWLFPVGVENQTGQVSPPKRHSRRFSRDSVTNVPRALADRDGYYQSLPPSAMFTGRRSSFDSVSDVSRPFSGSIYSTDDDLAGGGTMTVATSTHWSPGSTPPETARRMQSQFEKAYARESRKSLNLAMMSRRQTFGSIEGGVVVSDSTQSSTGTLGDKHETRVQIRQYPVQSPLQGPRPMSVGIAF